MLDCLFPDSSKEKVSWTKEKVSEEAKKYKNRSSFKYGSSGAYKFAYNNKLLDDLFGPTFDTPNCDNDVVYVWKVYGLPVYKIGVTSKRLSERRINYVCRKGNLQCEEKHIFDVLDATTVERALLSYGRPFTFDTKFSGHTEFRNLTRQEFECCLSILEQNKVKVCSYDR